MAAPARPVTARECRPGKWFRRRENSPGAVGLLLLFCAEDTEIPAAVLTKTPGPAQGVRITTILARSQPRICENPSPIFRNFPKLTPRESSAWEFPREDSRMLLLRPSRLRGLWPRLVLLAGADRGSRTKFAT